MPAKGLPETSVAGMARRLIGLSVQIRKDGVRSACSVLAAMHGRFHPAVARARR